MHIKYSETCYCEEIYLTKTSQKDIDPEQLKNNTCNLFDSLENTPKAELCAKLDKGNASILSHHALKL